MVSKLKKLSDLAININVKIAKELGFSGKKLTTIPIPKPKVEWRHKKDIKYQQTFHRYPNRPNTEDEKAEQARMVVHDLSERLGFDPNKLNDVRFGQIYNLMKKHGHTDDAGKIFSKEKVRNAVYSNQNNDGSWSAYNWLDNEDVLIVGAGPTLSKNKKIIEKT